MVDQGEKGSDAEPPETTPEERKNLPASPPSLVGEPDPRTIVSEKPYVSPKGNRYTIVETNELDPYEEPAPPEKPKPKDGD